MSQINETLVKEFVETLKAREELIASMKSDQAALIEKVKGLDAAVAIVQKARQPSAARLMAMGRWTGGVKPVAMDPEKKEAFLEWFTGVIKNDKKAIQDWYSHWYQAKATDLAYQTSAQGGYLVPDDFIPEIYALLLQESVFLREATRIPMAGMVLKMPSKLTGWTTYWGSEGGTITQGEPTFGIIQIDEQKLVGFGKISSELVEDSAPDIADYLIRQAVEGAASAIDTAGFDDPGASTGLPDATHTGILRLASNVVTVAATTYDPTYAELVDGLVKLTDSVSQGARLYMSKFTWGNIKKLTDTNGRPLWVPTIGDPDRDLIAGVPYTLVDRLPITETTHRNFMLYGNMKNIMYGDRREFRFERSDQFLFQSDQVALRFTQRIGFPNLASAAEVKNAFVRWKTTTNAG